MADETRRLIRVRSQKGATFKRDGFGKKKQLSDAWRKPRGQHNKQREQKKAKGALPKPGFGSPIAVRGMHPSGFFEVLVYTLDDLAGLDPKTQAIRIASTVGRRKRSALQEKAITAGLRVLNAKAVPAVTKPAPEAAPAEKPKEKKGEKQPSKKAKPAAPVKEEAAKAKKEPKKSPKAPAEKKVKEAKEPAPAEEPKKKEQKAKVPRAKAEPAAGDKPKKTAKPKAAPEKEAKAPRKTAPKTTAKPRKKPSTGVKDNE